MCLIIDNCVRDKCFASDMHPDAKPIFEWLYNKNGKIVYGGKLFEELSGLVKLRRILVELTRSGRARRIPDDLLNKEQVILKKGVPIQSNDSHVLALAIVSGARTLFTNDVALIRDFRNKTVIDNPRGAIYQHSQHWRLLKHTRSCGIKRIKSVSRDK